MTKKITSVKAECYDQHTLMERNDDDDRHRSSRRGPHFYMGSTDDPNEFLEDVVTSSRLGELAAVEQMTTTQCSWMLASAAVTSACAGCCHNGGSMAFQVLQAKYGML